MRTHTALLATIVALSATRDVAASPASGVRGVAPADAARYQPLAGESVNGAPGWRCLTSGESIPFSAINDDYCDCSDGSDEPGTSACPGSKFYCANEGHVPAFVPSSRVGDGLCDPECCDGSDEALNPLRDGSVRCANTCAEVGRKARLLQAQRDAARRAGAKIRAGYVSKATKALANEKTKVERLTVEITQAEKKVADLKAAFEDASQRLAADTAAKKALPSYKALVAAQHQLAADEAARQKLLDELEHLTELLDGLAGGYNPNYQDMAVKGTVMEYRSWKAAHDFASDQEGGNAEHADTGGSVNIAQEPPVRMNQLRDLAAHPPPLDASSRVSVPNDEPAPSDDEAFLLLNQNPLDLVDSPGISSNSKAGLLFRIHEYLPDSVVPYFEATVDTLLDLLAKANVLGPHEGDDTGGERDEARKERLALEEAEGHLRKLEGEFKDAKMASTLEPSIWGPDGEWKALDGSCVEWKSDSGEYVYELCFGPGARAVQKPQRGGSQITLGRFDKFNVDQPTELGPREDPEHFFASALYNNGQRCWNGPDRSAVVKITCGTENALTNVFEAEKCIYNMAVTTPAVCYPLPEKKTASAPADVRSDL